MDCGAFGGKRFSIAVMAFSRRPQAPDQRARHEPSPCGLKRFEANRMNQAVEYVTTFPICA